MSLNGLGTLDDRDELLDEQFNELPYYELLDEISDEL